MPQILLACMKQVFRLSWLQSGDGGTCAQVTWVLPTWLVESQPRSDPKYVNNNFEIAGILSLTIDLHFLIALQRLD